MESQSLIKIVVDSLLSGVPAQSLSDARKILGYLRTQIGTKVTCNLTEMRDNDIGWHTLFAADIYLFNQQPKEKHSSSNKTRWGFYSASRTKTSL
jgi:hypothetical protein